MKLRIWMGIMALVSWGFSLSGQSHTVYLVGDAGELFENGNPVLSLLGEHLAHSDENNTVLYLGDNVYPRGLPEERHRNREEAEQILLRQLEVFKGFKGNVFMIPGNHDWDKGKPKGYSYITNQERFVESALVKILEDSVNAFLPDNGCPGPVEIEITPELTLIVLDTQWLLHPWEKPRAEEGCGVERSAELFGLMQEMLRQNSHKKIIVASHHPMYTYGIHGGVSNFNDHLFPLTAVNESLYIPLPIIGSIYPLYRKLLGNVQDIPHPKNKAIRQSLEELYRDHANLIHVSGHEHSLQYSYKDSVHYVVSGSGSKSTYVKQKKYAQWVHEGLGFSKIIYEANGSVSLEFWSPEQKQQPIYKKELYKEPYHPLPEISDLILNFSDSTVWASASEQYDTKSPGFMGENYRIAWKTKTEVPVFDIGTAKGGLQIIQRGGGQQTRSLRLKNPQGQQYVLRSIEKYAEKAVPEPLRGTVGAELVQDQISASHPYAAFVIPELAEAAEIYHTNPKLVFIPNDPRFGVHQRDFANQLALFEERAAGNRKDLASFGNAKKIISTPDMLEELYDDNDNLVDQKWVLKSRLFDMIIADWDRHDDQWRWARFKEDKGHSYRPIPRDRDQAFFVNDGFLMNQVRRKWSMPKFQGFDYEFSYVPGFNYNARYFDRDFLTEPSLKDWLDAAEKLQNNLTDEVIEEAIRQWPEPIYELNGDEVVAKLKSQRNNLRDYARKQYLFLSKYVNVRGSDKKEYFLVERLDDNHTRVSMYKRTKENDQERLLYERIFNRYETKEIRLYGLDGDDLFEILGEAKKGIIVRVIGGPGEDIILDKSTVNGAGRKTKVYDNLNNNTLELGKEAQDLTSEDPLVNSYNRKEVKYDKLFPIVLGSINRDDGLFVGGGFLLQKHGFRKEPFRSQNLVTASVAFATGAFNIKYRGVFTDVMGPWNLKLGLSADVPNITNYFGLGNETTFNQNADEEFNVDRSVDYYRVRYQYFDHYALLAHDIGNHATISFGHHYQMADVSQDYDGEDRLFLDSLPSENFFENKFFEGAVMAIELDNRDNPRLPTRGIHWVTDARGYLGLNSLSQDYLTLNSELALYFSVRLPSRLTFAFRFGVGHNFGDTEFYQAQTLSGTKNLRGYRKNRFIGDSRFYNNTELRLKIATIRNKILPVSVGINAFHDVGRVWVDGEDSNKWHNSYGGGVWIAPLNAAVINLDLSNSEEQLLFNLRLGFLF